MEIPKTYDPKQAEESHYARWEREGYFAPEINRDPSAPVYSIAIPPPNVTGSLHMGHALQHTMMDVLIRHKRMSGYRTLWVTGTDHAGISTQLVVSRELKKEGLTRHDLGREKFVERVWRWKAESGGAITRQMRREGASVDWSRERFTMDEGLSRAVREVFVRLYEEGHIYRGARIVNWCPTDQTVLSDLEVVKETKKDGKLYFLQYPIKGERAAPDGGDDAARDDARRHGGRGQPFGRALQRPRRRDHPAAARRAARFPSSRTSTSIPLSAPAPSRSRPRTTRRTTRWACATTSRRSSSSTTTRG